MTSTILHVFRRRPFVYILNIFQGFHDYIRIDFVEQTPTVSEVVDIKREHAAIVFTGPVTIIDCCQLRRKNRPISWKGYFHQRNNVFLLLI